MKKHTGKNRMGGPVKMQCSQQTERHVDGSISVLRCDAEAVGLKAHVGRKHKKCKFGGVWK